MKTVRSVKYSRGAVTIFVSMILLLLITILVLAAYSLSTSNLRAVGNVQLRNEGIAAANRVIEEQIPGTFWLIEDVTYPKVDLNYDGTDDFTVTLLVPKCIRARQASGSSSSSVTLPGMSSSDSWHTVWELDATAREPNLGTEVRVVHGVRLMMSTALKNKYCTP